MRRESLVGDSGTRGLGTEAIFRCPLEAGLCFQKFRLIPSAEE